MKRSVMDCGRCACEPPASGATGGSMGAMRNEIADATYVVNTRAFHTAGRQINQSARSQ
ncbi:MAG: hypothetical protein WAQ28_03995 [Bacteroidia bacterium]